MGKKAEAAADVELSSSYGEEEERVKKERKPTHAKNKTKKKGKKSQPTSPTEAAKPIPAAEVRPPGQRKDYHFKLFKTPKEGAVACAITAQKKCDTPPLKQFIQAFMAGVYISLGGLWTMTVAGSTITDNKALNALLGALFFPYVLMVIIFTGAELFTGNILIDTIGLLNRTITPLKAARHLALSYCGNFTGAVVTAFLLVWLGESIRDSNLGYAQYCAELVMKKVNDFGWGMYFVKGIYCNLLVCLAVYMSVISESQEGKILSIWWPIASFVATGLEHSIANMFMVPSAMMLLGGGHHYGGRDPAELAFTYKDFRGNSYLLNFTNMTDVEFRNTEAFPHFGDFLAWNLIPVSLGNVIGGVWLGSVLYYVFLTPRAQNPPSHE